MKKVAVCLSGCGHLDGTEIHEAVCVLLALDRADAEIVCCAPEIEQARLANHVTRQVQHDKPTRDVLVESARIARGQIQEAAGLDAADLDALIIPGGQGAARNLCTFALEGADCNVEPSIEMLIAEMAEAGKPIGAVCIAPVLLARVLGARRRSPRVTVGNDPATADAIRAMGACHLECAATDCVVDTDNRLVTTPAYMLASRPSEVWTGIEKLVEQVLKMA